MVSLWKIGAMLTALPMLYGSHKTKGNGSAQCHVIHPATNLKGVDKMLADARDFMIILWVFMQGFGWFHPESYGMFQAQVEQAYLEHADRLGYWTEE